MPASRRARPRRLLAVAELDAGARSASAIWSQANGSSRASSRRRALDDRHLRAERRPGLRELDADDAAAEDASRSGISLVVVASRFVHGSRLGEAVDRRHPARAARSRRRRPSRPEQLVVADQHAPLAVEPSAAADERDPAFLEPGELLGVVEVVDDLVAAASTAGDVELADTARRARHAPGLGEQLAGPQQRLRGHAGVERALAADQVRLD